MPRSKPSWILTAAFAMMLCVVPRCLAGDVLETRDFADAVTAVEQAVAKHGAENVLMVCDIDNTLLAMNHDLGSDQWFEWQSYLLNNEPDSPDLVAEDFGELLDAQGVLFSLGRMHPPQAGQPAQIEQVQAMGVRTLVLTSRGDDYRDATERELAANGYDFAKSVLPVESCPCGVFQPYDPNDVQAAGLTTEEARRWGLAAPRGVSFAEGVFMSAGQHKGAMLIMMLARSQHEFKAVVFVDDHGRHVLRVYEALTARGMDVTTVHYKREDVNVKRFTYSDKAEVRRQWRQLNTTLEAVFR